MMDAVNLASAVPGQELFESFMSFPAPLVIADLGGHPQLVNAQYRQRFGTGMPDATHLAAAGDEAVVQIHGGAQDGVQTTVRTVRTAQSLLMIFTEFFDAGSEAQFSRLQSRVAELEKRVATDYLTGAWNRAHLDRVIETELARSASMRQPLTLVLFDIDHFKHINDTYGHAAGDAVLRELVERMRTRLRSADLLFRWGGEEFVVLLCSAGYRAASAVAEELRIAAADHEFPDVGKVTVSLGVAEHAVGESAGAWFERLDAALYAAKDGGRNRVVVDRRGSSDDWAADGGAALHLIWQEGYESGNHTIDAEHRELFRLSNVLIDSALRSTPDALAFRAALQALLEHVARHFADEEVILARSNYADLEVHRRAHAALLKRAWELERQVEQGKIKLGAIVEYLAQDVVARHILVMDRAFFPLFFGS